MHLKIGPTARRRIAARSTSLCRWCGGARGAGGNQQGDGRITAVRHLSVVLPLKFDMPIVTQRNVRQNWENTGIG
jgi:hypothetical protein